MSVKRFMLRTNVPHLKVEMRGTRQRGEVLITPYAERVMATLHPSAILRARDAPMLVEMMEMFKADMRKVAALVWERVRALFHMY